MGNGEQGTGNRERGTENGEQGTGNRIGKDLLNNSPLSPLSPFPIPDPRSPIPDPQSAIKLQSDPRKKHSPPRNPNLTVEVHFFTDILNIPIG
ncbi:hypothetical protein B4U84_14015 [Westiellopsis prolifica IICB1]|nr:hypothetical protein B4U84_14015 [Westiellopsis prolifica IICB1]